MFRSNVNSDSDFKEIARNNLILILLQPVKLNFFY